MKIRVETGDGHRFVIPIPTLRLLEPLGAKVLSAAARRDGEMMLSYAQARALLRSAREAKAILGDLPLLEVADADGAYVRIDL